MPEYKFCLACFKAEHHFERLPVGKFTLKMVPRTRADECQCPCHEEK